MSTFKIEVEDLIGLVNDDTMISDTLTDAAAEIINLLPKELLWSVSEVSTTQDTNGYSVESARIISVFRERGVDDEFVACEPVEIRFERHLQDINSLFYPSINLPKFTLKDAKIYVYPTPSASNGFQARSVAYPTVVHGDSTIAVFPDGLEFIVVLGAALKCSIRLMSDVLGNIPSAITLPTAPTAPAAPVYSYTDATGASIAATAIGSFGTAPNYTAPVTTPDFSTFDTKIGTNDYEEARVIREKIDSQIAEYSSDIQNQLNDLNKQNLEYQGKIQDEITQAQLDQQRLIQAALITTDVDKQNKIQELAATVQEYQANLALYQNDIQIYGAKSNALIQDYSSKVQRFLSEYASRIQSYPLLLERYNSALKPLIGDSNGR